MSITAQQLVIQKPLTGSFKIYIVKSGQIYVCLKIG